MIILPRTYATVPGKSFFHGTKCVLSYIIEIKKLSYFADLLQLFFINDFYFPSVDCDKAFSCKV